MRLVRMVRKLPGGLDMIQVFPSEVEQKKAEGYKVIKVREGEDPLEVYQRGLQAAEKPAPPPEPPDSDVPPAEASPAELLAQKSKKDLKIIAKQYGVENLEAGKDDLIVEILRKAGYQVERVNPKGKQPQQQVELDQQVYVSPEDSDPASAATEPAAPAPAPAEPSASSPEASEK